VQPDSWVTDWTDDMGDTFKRIIDGKVCDDAAS
jgi:hypothetical protein